MASIGLLKGLPSTSLPVSPLGFSIVLLPVDLLFTFAQDFVRNGLVRNDRQETTPS